VENIDHCGRGRKRSRERGRTIVGSEQSAAGRGPHEIWVEVIDVEVDDRGSVPLDQRLNAPGYIGRLGPASPSIARAEDGGGNATDRHEQISDIGIGWSKSEIGDRPCGWQPLAGRGPRESPVAARYHL
jgi:hypothetical protein